MTEPVMPAWAAVPEDLGRLAAAYGVATEYWDQSGGLVQVGAATVSAVLAALGLDVSSDDAIGAALEEKRLRDWRRMLPPVFVMRQGEDRRLWVHIGDGHPARAWIIMEDGGRLDLEQMDFWVEPVEVDGRLVGEAVGRIVGGRGRYLDANRGDVAQAGEGFGDARGDVLLRDGVARRRIGPRLGARYLATGDDHDGRPAVAVRDREAVAFRCDDRAQVVDAPCSRGPFRTKRGEGVEE